MVIQKTTLAAMCLIGALLLSSGAYGSDWPDLVQGLALGLLAVGSVNFTVSASRMPRPERERARQDAR